jgi:UDPglucose 6-dehydrogenase
VEAVRITIAGTGYVGLVTGVCLAEIGHHVTCLDVNPEKVKKMTAGISPIYEPGLEELMKRNLEAGRIHFTIDQNEAYTFAEVIYIAVGTPENKDGSANLMYIDEVATSIGRHICLSDVIVVTKSTVPVGTNKRIQHILNANKSPNLHVEVVSNPEFLREGSAIHDTFHGDRIIIGTSNEKAAAVLTEINKPFGIPIMVTDINSAEMTKYASNAFLATKISFINEVANICEKLGANIDDVARGIGLDKRIGSQFLQAGIGYGGSCFPKDTKALVQIAGNVEHKFELLESVIKVNNDQQEKLVQKAKDYFGSLKSKKATILGLAFKPDTDDIREAASLVIINRLLEEGATVVAYDPIAIRSAQKTLGESIDYCDSVQEALLHADVAFIVTEWGEIKETPLSSYKKWMNEPIIFDGRNCYRLEEAQAAEVVYYSVGREWVNLHLVSSTS